MLGKGVGQITKVASGCDASLASHDFLASEFEQEIFGEAIPVPLDRAI
jgi:hypothetical protein